MIKIPYIKIKLHTCKKIKIFCWESLEIGLRKFKKKKYDAEIYWITLHNTYLILLSKSHRVILMTVWLRFINLTYIFFPLRNDFLRKFQFMSLQINHQQLCSIYFILIVTK